MVTMPKTERVTVRTAQCPQCATVQELAADGFCTWEYECSVRLGKRKPWNQQPWEGNWP